MTHEQKQLLKPSLLASMAVVTIVSSFGLRGYCSEVSIRTYSTSFRYCHGIRVHEDNSRRGYFYLDRKSNIVAGPFYFAYPFQEGVGVVWVEDGTTVGGVSAMGCGLIDRDGEFVVSPVYVSMLAPREGIVVALNYEGQWGAIDYRGREVVPFVFDEMRSFHDGFAGVKRNGKWGFIAKNGNLKVPVRFDDIGHFGSGLAPVRMDEKWGAIDVNGDVVVAAEFDAFRPFSEGLAAVCRDGKWFFIDVSGKRLGGDVYDDVGSFSEGLAKVRRGEVWGFIRRDGSELIEPRFTSAGDFHEGVAVVGVRKGGVTAPEMFGYLSNRGTLAKIPSYHQASRFSEGLAVVTSWRGEDARTFTINHTFHVVSEVDSKIFDEDDEQTSREDAVSDTD